MSLSGVVCGGSSDSEIVTVKCEECGKGIPLEEWIEHTDYHVAAKLQDTIKQITNFCPIYTHQVAKISEDNTN